MHGPKDLLEYGTPRAFWSQNREASLNWLALGLLLAAWNACDDDHGQKPQRPEALRHHAFVSVRAAQRSARAARHSASAAQCSARAAQHSALPESAAT